MPNKTQQMIADYFNYERSLKGWKKLSWMLFGSFESWAEGYVAGYNASMVGLTKACGYVEASK